VEEERELGAGFADGAAGEGEQAELEPAIHLQEQWLAVFEPAQ
jgi:hypothetical protein